ncbi:DUF4376 domain-containing protein [Salipiger sp. PrR003]|uniref:DUF4376 domain-containing protein n=1 Tax=Salipiger sp. PrR003 TaxID=2706776 RepID=UPI0013DD21FC|nr:DUF4376 domain-containing protein [Salipiger sp. PrR003]NDV51349.1 DUF4376 domain-containing protein [Salipiger sp. PrR003]
MRLYYDEGTGAPTFTANIREGNPGPPGPYVEISDDIGDLTTWRVNLSTLELEAVELPAAPEDVTAERDRRINGGFTFDGVVYQTRPEDRENMAGAATSALAAITDGAQAGDLRWHGGGSDFAWIAQDNTLVPMDAQTMLSFGQAAMAHKQAHIFAARALKDLPEPPSDITDDALWPA